MFISKKNIKIIIINAIFSIGLILEVQAKAEAFKSLNNEWNEPPPPVLYLGMWTLHLIKKGDSNATNDLLGFSYKNFFAGTFRNSFGDRSYAAGIGGYWINSEISDELTYHLGYRLGLIYGYDERFMPIAGKLPILPFPQVISSFTWKKIGWEVSWVGVILTTEFYIRL